MDDSPGSQSLRGALGAGLAVALGVVALAAPVVMRRTSSLVARDAPDFSLEVVNDAEGARLHLAELRGHPVVLDFWATWCGPCRAETPVLKRLAERMRERGVTVVGVNTSDEPGKAAAYARDQAVTYPVVFDQGSRVAAQYGVSVLPTIVVIGASGRVAAVRSGFEDDAQLDALIAQAE